MHDPSVLAGADRHPQPVALGAGAPADRRVEDPEVPGAQQGREVRRTPLVEVAGRPLDVAEREQSTGERLGRRRAAPIWRHVHRLPVDHQPRARLLGRGEPQQRRAGRRQVQGGRVVPPVVVEDQQQVRVGGQQGPQLPGRGAHQAARADGVAVAGAVGVREPLHPVPVRQRGLVGQHRHGQRGGRVEGRRGAHQGARHRTRRVRRAEHLDAGPGGEVDGDRQVGLGAVHREQPVCGGDGRRVGPGGARVVVWHQLESRRLGGHPAAHLQEPRGARGALPDPGALRGERGERRGRRVVPRERGALLVPGRAGPGTHRRQVVQVVRAGAADLLGALGTLAVDLHDHEAHGRDQEQARRQQPQPVGAAAHRGDQDHRAEAPEHRHGARQHAAGPLGRLQLGRRLEHDPAGGQGEGRGRLARCRHGRLRVWSRAAGAAVPAMLRRRAPRPALPAPMAVEEPAVRRGGDGSRPVRPAASVAGAGGLRAGLWKAGEPGFAVHDER